MAIVWEKRAANLESKQYVCGYCGSNIASSEGYHGIEPDFPDEHFIYICHHCDKPTYIDCDGNQAPSGLSGDSINHLPLEIEKLYREARICIGSNAFTAAVLSLRKLLMNVSVSQGAAEGLKFVEYVNYLEEEGHIPKGGRGWIDQIRKKGNEATHDIVIMDKETAVQLLSFMGMLLKLTYEFPESINPSEKKK